MDGTYFLIATEYYWSLYLPHSPLPASYTHTALAARDFRYAGPSIWNSLLRNLRSINSYTAFKPSLKLTYSQMQTSHAFSEYLMQSWPIRF